MASATRLPLKSILLTASIILGVGATRPTAKKAMLSIFTGPGKYSRIAAFLIVLANLKNFPFVWHVCSTSTLLLYGNLTLSIVSSLVRYSSPLPFRQAQNTRQYSTLNPFLACHNQFKIPSLRMRLQLSQIQLNLLFRSRRYTITPDLCLVPARN
jgi:hypothetical protein